MNILIVVKNIKEGGVVRAAVNYKKCFESIRCNVKFYVIENASKEYIRFYNIKKKDLYNNNNLEEKWIADIGFIISHGITLKDFISLDNIFKKKLFEINIFSTPSPYENNLEESFQLSKWMRFLYQLRGGVHDGRILPHAVNSDDFFYEPKNIIRKKYKIPMKSKILLRVGQDSIGKWSFLILKAFKVLCLKDPNFFLVLLGAPDQIKKSIHNLDFDIKNRIIILNFKKDYGYLRNLYSEANLFWHIADQGESFGYVLAESLLCKTPVITLQTPWADNTQSEMIGESVSGAGTSLEGFSSVVFGNPLAISVVTSAISASFSTSISTSESDSNSTFSLSVITPSLVITLIRTSFPSVSFNEISCSPSGAGVLVPSSETTSTVSPTSNVGDSNIVPSFVCASVKVTSSVKFNIFAILLNTLFEFISFLFNFLTPLIFKGVIFGLI